MSSPACDWLRGQCLRYTQPDRKCTLTGCLLRGGYIRGGQPIVYDQATCQAHEIIVGLKALREEIAPVAAQIICPKDNTFSRQVALIDRLLGSDGLMGGGGRGELAASPVDPKGTNVKLTDSPREAVD